MSVQGFIVLQVLIPFISYSISKCVVCVDLFNISNYITLLKWIFGLSLLLYVHNKIQIVGNRNAAIIAVVLCMISHYYSKSLLDMFAVIGFVIWCQFLNFFDYSWREFTTYVRRKWIKLFRKSFLLFVCFNFIVIFMTFRYFLFFVFTTADLESVLLRSAFIYDEKLPRLYTNVVLNQTEDRDNLHSIRLDYDNNQRRLLDLDHRFPICKRLIYRHLGEDVKIKCKWPTEYIMIEYYESNWTLNGKDVEYSDNMKISSTQGNYNSDVLSIFFINRNDFGEYQLWVSGVPSENRLRIFNTISYLVASIRVSQKVDMVHYIYVPVGNLLILDYHIDYSLHNEVLDWKYNIESKLAGGTSLEKHSERMFFGCSLFSYFLLKVIMYTVDHIYDFNKPKFVWMSNKTISIHAFLCTTELSYGNHSFHITREFYNNTIQANQNVTTPLHIYLMILPAKSYINNMYAINYDKYQNTSFEDVKNSDLLDEITILFIRQTIEVILFATNAFISAKFCKYFSCLLDIHIVSALFKYVFDRTCVEGKHSSDGCLGNIETEHSTYEYEYDVLILTTEDDNNFVIENEIITCLEDIECKVCFPDRDFKAGYSRFQLFSQSVQKSNTIIVLCSKEFLGDYFMNDIVFGDFIMTRYENEKCHDRNILLIKLDDCKIPSVLRRKCAFLDASDLFLTNGCIKNKICAWVKSRIPRFNINFVIFKELVFIMVVNTISLVLPIILLILKYTGYLSESTIWFKLTNTPFDLLLGIFCSMIATICSYRLKKHIERNSVHEMKCK